jgi:hypothetical protein
MSSLFKSKQPEIQKPAPMPDDQSADVLEAQRRARSDTMKRKGRSSTIMSGSSDFGTYASSDLGAQ